MPLKAFVKVGTLANLGDVRYCAGMGVDMIGFQVISGHADYVAPSRFQEIRGWVNGPLFVAEIYGLNDSSVLEAILEDYKPDYLEMGIREVALLARFPVPYILNLKPGESMPDVAILPSWIIAKEIGGDKKIPVLLQVDTAEGMAQAINSSGVNGIVLKVDTHSSSSASVPEVLGYLLELLEEE